MAIQFYPKNDTLSNHGARWGDHRSSGRRRGGAVFYEILNEIGVSPGYYAEVQADGSYVIWGDTPRREGKCASDGAAMKAVEAFVEDEYKRLLGVEVAKLEATVAEIRARM